MDMMALNMTSFVKLKDKIKTVLIPIGMIEAHGPHASLGTDILIPREFARRLELPLGESLIIGPEIPYGHAGGLAGFPGTIDISTEAFAHYVYEVGKGFYNNGMKNIILFNGHGGNIPSLQWVAEKLADLGAVVLTINWWLDYREVIERITPHVGHAGEDETSCVLAINEKLVDQNNNLPNHKINVPKNVRFKGFGKMAYPNAYSGAAGAATMEKGEKIYEALLPLIERDIRRFIELSSELKISNNNTK